MLSHRSVSPSKKTRLAHMGEHSSVVTESIRERASLINDDREFGCLLCGSAATKWQVKESFDSCHGGAVKISSVILRRSACAISISFHRWQMTALTVAKFEACNHMHKQGEILALDAMQRAAVRMRRRGVSAAVAAWKASAELQRATDRACRLVLHRMVWFNAVRGFESWRRFTRWHKDDVARQALLARDLQYRRLAVSSMRRVVIRMRRAQFSQGFRTWSIAARDLARAAMERKRQLEDGRRREARRQSVFGRQISIMVKTIARALKMQLFRPFNHWCIVGRLLLEEQVWGVAVMNSVLRRLLNSALQAGFRGWCGWVRWDRGEAARQALAASELGKQTAGLTGMRRVLKRMDNAKLAAGFRSWCATVAAHKRSEQEARDAEEATRAKREQLQQENQRTIAVIVKAIQRAIRVQLFRPFSHWLAAVHQLAEAQRRAVAVMTRTITRMQNALLAAGWGAWTAFLDAFYAAARMVMGRMLHFNLSMGLVQWKRYVQWERNGERQRTAMAMVGRALARMQRAQLTKGLSTWRAHVYAISRRMSMDGRTLKLMFKTIQRALRMQLFKPFHHWLTALKFESDAQRRVLSVMSKIVLRLQQEALTAGFQAWCAWNRRLAAERMTLTRTLGTMRRVVNRMDQSALWRGMMSWKAFHRMVEDVKLRLGSLTVTVKLIIKGKVGVYFQNWVATIQMENSLNNPATLRKMVSPSSV